MLQSSEGRFHAQNPGSNNRSPALGGLQIPDWLVVGSCRVTSHPGVLDSKREEPGTRPGRPLYGVPR